MALYADDKKQEIRDRIRIEDLVRDYNIILQPAGGGRWKGLCPFHAEKTPSFHVNAEGQFFHCFGCKAGGDIFTFLQRVESVTFPEAMEMLARRAGVILEPVTGPRRGGAATGIKTALYEALSLARDYFHKALISDPRAERARQYLARRKLRPEMWERFALGYSPPDGDALLRHALSRGVRQEVLEQAGLVRDRTGGDQGCYDYFRGRVMFPIGDGQKRIVGFGARTLGDDQPKYLNSPKTVLFDKSQVLYGLPQSRAAIEKEKRIAIVEGYTDAIAAHQEGLEFFVASLGTAFTADNARRLRRLAPRVDLVFDGDFAGQSAAERSLSLLVSEDLEVRVVGLSGGKDPCDCILEEGGRAFRERMDRDSIGIFEFKWRRSLAAVGGERPDGEDRAGVDRPASPAERARALDEVLDLLGRVPNVVARKLHVQEFAERLGVPARDIESRLRKRRAAAPPRAGAPNDRRAAAPFPESSVRGGGPAVRPAESAGRRSASGDDNPTLGEVIIEVLLTEPDRAAARWRELPEGVFEEDDRSPSEIGSIARALEELIEAGMVDVERLVGRLENPDAVPLLARILGRIESKTVLGRSRVDASIAMSGAENTDEIWERCRRDLERNSRWRRRREIEARLARARAEGDADALLAANKEYRELLREMAQ